MTVHRILIVRHGETDYNAQHRWQGHLDIPLNYMGIQQAEKAAAYLANEPVDAIFASDLSRAFMTAEAIAKLRQMRVIPEPRLREIHVGAFQGLTRAELEQRFPEELVCWNNDDAYAPPQGESRLQLQERAYAAFQDITNRDDMQSVLIVSHGGTLRMLFRKLLPPEQIEGLRFNNTSISILERQKTAWKMIAINTTRHLDSSNFYLPKKLKDYALAIRRFLS
jgi:broad specificity phosphatase PhoE